MPQCGPAPHQGSVTKDSRRSRHSAQPTSIRVSGRTSCPAFTISSNGQTGIRQSVQESFRLLFAGFLPIGPHLTVARLKHEYACPMTTRGSFTRRQKIKLTCLFGFAYEFEPSRVPLPLVAPNVAPRIQTQTNSGEILRSLKQLGPLPAEWIQFLHPCRDTAFVTFYVAAPPLVQRNVNCRCFACGREVAI